VTLDEEREDRVGCLAGEAGELGGAPHAEHDRGQPERDEHGRVEAAHVLEGGGVAGGEDAHEHVREGDHGEGDRQAPREVGPGGEGALDLLLEQGRGGAQDRGGRLGRPAEASGDEEEGGGDEAEEGRALEDVGPHGRAHPAEGRVGDRDREDQRGGCLKGQRALGEHLGGEARADHRRDHVRERVDEEGGEEGEADGGRGEALGVELGRGEGAEAAGGAAGGLADQIEGQGDAEADDRRVEAEDADAQVVGLAGDAEQDEGRDVGPEEGHEEDEGAGGAAAEEVVLGRAEVPAGSDEADREGEGEVEGDDEADRGERAHGASSSGQTAREVM